MQTIAANLGSMATPIGNPQNLYLYAHYKFSASVFIQTMLPYTIVSLACMLLFLSFQNPLEVPGVTLSSFLRNAWRHRQGGKLKVWAFQKELERVMSILQMEEAYGERELNVGFSGGEKKKAEILQMLMLRPALAILDETDSGLDVDAVRTVSRGV